MAGRKNALKSDLLYTTDRTTACVTFPSTKRPINSAANLFFFCRKKTMAALLAACMICWGLSDTDTQR